jgi:hypothetical protein
VKESKQSNNEVKNQKQESAQEKEAWKQLGKDEKKTLLQELKDEEIHWKEEMGRDDMSKKEWKEIKSQIESEGGDKPNEDEGEDETDPLQQYQTLVTQNVNLNTLNALWKSLSKEEKKQIFFLQEGKLIMNEKGEVMDNPDYVVDKLTKEEKKDLMKQETNSDGKDVITQNSNVVNDHPKPEEDSKDPPNSEANTFVNNQPVIESQPDVESTSSTSSTVTSTSGAATTTTSTTKKPKTSTTTSTTSSEEDMTQNSHPIDQSNNFVIPMPQISSSSTTSTTSISGSSTVTTTTSSSSTYASISSSCNGCYTFATTLQDPSIPMDGSELKWTLSGQPWSTYTTGCYKSDSCIMSGITSDLSREMTHSNLTLTTDREFEGGILTFYFKGELQMPNDAFFVSVDDVIASSTISDNNEWVEYGVVVGKGQHIVTWTHVYNPLGLESLPDRTVGGIIVDDLRYSPFQKGRSFDQGFEDDSTGLLMTSDGDALWQIDDGTANSGSYSIVAKTKNIKSESGSSNVHFVLYSHLGGTLKYKIASSTTAPHDDFAVLFNGKPVEAVFGVTRTLPLFEYREMEVPMGKVVVTFQHRKNPGNLSRSLLDSLGEVATAGVTRLDDVKFVPFSS